MNSFPIREKVQLPYQVFYFPPTHFFREKLLLWKGSILSNELSCLWICDRRCTQLSPLGILLRHFSPIWFELIMMKPFHISISTPNFKKRQLWFLAKP